MVVVTGDCGGSVGGGGCVCVGGGGGVCGGDSGVSGIAGASNVGDFGTCQKNREVGILVRNVQVPVK